MQVKRLPRSLRSWCEEARHNLVERAAIYAESRYGDPAHELTERERAWVVQDVRNSWAAWQLAYPERRRR